MEITPSRIGFVATHLNSSDHVSFESSIWRGVLTDMGHECFFFTGESTQPEERTVIVPEADIRHPDVQNINQALSDNAKRSSKTSGVIQALRFHIKQHLHQFIQTFDINILIVENALSLPANIPLGLALSEVIAETGITTIARHHDFAWEHAKYQCSPARDYIHSGFPPKLPSVQHLVATSSHADELAMRVGVHARVIPYVRDFQNSPNPLPLNTRQIADELGLPSGEVFVLSASPLLPTSRIDATLAFIARLDRKPELLLTTYPVDMDQDYLRNVMETADLLEVKVHLVGEYLHESSRANLELTSKLENYYQCTAVVCTFGQTQSATAEAIDSFYYRKPMITSRHNPAFLEFKDRGFRFFELDSYPHLEAVRGIEDSLTQDEELAIMAENNFMLARQDLSLDILREKLANALRETLTP